MKGKFGEWTPCSAGMPDEKYFVYKGIQLYETQVRLSDLVLVSLKDEDGEKEVDISYTIDGKWVFKEHLMEKVEAWMPLPELYEGKDE